MSAASRRRLLCLLLGALFLLRQDTWWWHSPQRLLGLPLGLTFQILICLAAALVLGLLAYGAWPDGARDARPRA